MSLAFRKIRISVLALLVCLLVTLASYNFDVKGQTQNLSFEVAFPNLTFNQPDSLFADPTNANRLFVTEQAGVIKVFNKNPKANASGIFLDITNKVLYGGEQGLLGLAFHPNFTENHYFYVNYVADNPRRTIIARYTLQVDNPDIADINTEQIIMEINQPFTNHKGGQLTFGTDRYLYIGVGDGGSEGDPLGNGQNLSTLLAKILRINIDSSSSGRNYSIPSDNPFFGNSAGFREEIYAYGLRNPWRFSFDSAGRLWVGDVGQDQLEEIDLVEKGRNYGWNVMEGSFCHNPARDCNQTGLELPIWNYTHDLGNAIIGGYVYSGTDLPSLVGAYVYGDYGSGRIWALRYNGKVAENTLLANTHLNIASFGLDKQSEIYFTAYNGKIYHFQTNIIPEFSWQISLVSFFAVTSAMIVYIKTVKVRRLKR